MALSRETLRALSKARKRPEKLALGKLDQHTISDLLEFYDLRKQENILDSALRGRAEQNLAVEDSVYLSEAYRQIELQGLRAEGDPKRRQDYTQDINSSLMQLIFDAVGPCYRSRISTLRPGGTIPKHVDDPNQIRVISVLQGQHRFTLFANGKANVLPMGIGELWFINTAWEHAVGNTGSVDRIALLLNLFELPEAV